MLVHQKRLERLSASLGIHNVKSLGCLRSFPKAFYQQLAGNYRINWNRPGLLLADTQPANKGIPFQWKKGITCQNNMNMNNIWEPFNSYHSTHQTPCKFEYCLDQAEVNRPADDTCVALSLQTTCLNKTVRGPRLQSLVLMGQGHQWPRQVGWEGMVWGTPPACPPHCQGLVAGRGCWRQEVSLRGLPQWFMQGREVLQRTALEQGPCFKLLASVSILNLPAFQPLPAHWLTHPDSTTNGAALVMSIPILARCVSVIKSQTQLVISYWATHLLGYHCNFTLISQGNHNPSLNHHMYNPI